MRSKITSPSETLGTVCGVVVVVVVFDRNGKGVWFSVVEKLSPRIAHEDDVFVRKWNGQTIRMRCYITSERDGDVRGAISLLAKRMRSGDVRPTCATI